MLTVNQQYATGTNLDTATHGILFWLSLLSLLFFTGLTHAVVIELPTDCDPGMGGPGGGMGCGGGLPHLR